MSRDPRTLKYQMMMSPREADEIDDWMFKNRVRSRAEAIRQLVQIGLGHSESPATLAQARNQTPKEETP